ncbi:MAG: alginate lyase family protein [Verrucomicrobia bacterium]|nr:alginate lyase family protein [Verrucomicrobiota bacterium]MCH8527447.1 alginate lyase family protein [Kiritimatiellia bacterium]
MSLLTGAEPAFQRPGTLHTATDLDAAHARARSGRIPWTAAWDALLAEAEEFLSQKPSAPVQYSVPARYQDAEGHQRERNRLSSQSRAAYSLALASQLLSRSERPGDQERSERYARHALSILNEWADKNRDMGADADPFVRRETALVTATSGGGLLIAADLLYHHPAWSEKARQTFLSWIREYVLPATAIKTISYNNNWNAWGNYLSLLCAHLLEDPEIFQSDVALWKNDLFHHIVEDGRMPKELARGGGRNWYTYYALLPITTAAVVIHNSTGENLLEPGTRTGDRVKAGLDYFFDNLKGHIYRSLIEASGDLYRDEAYMEWNKGSRPVLGNRAHTGWVHPTLFTTWEDMPVNHPPVASVSGPEGPVAPGTPVRLDASASEDPDGGELTFNWFLAGERRVDEFYEPLLSSGDLIYFREPLNGPFDIYFTITMLENTDMLVGLQSSNRSGFEWGSSSFQVNTNNGRFQVRDGNRYRALEDISYAPGIPYQLRWSVDPAAKTYSVRVREMEDGDWVHLASDFRPRDGNDDFVDMAKIIYSGREGALIQDIEVHTLGKNFPGPVLNFTPATPGEHVVQLTVTDELGAIDTRKITVKVEDHLP